jgi:hypothetical protein
MVRFLSISDKKLVTALHITAWIIIISIPLYLNNAFGGGDQHRLYQFYTHTFSAIIVFYVGYLWMVPKLFLRGKNLLYAVSLVGLITATYYLTSYINDNLLYDAVQDAKFQELMKKLAPSGKEEHPPWKAFGLYNHILASLMISGFALGLGVMEKLKQNEKKQKELEKEKLHSELAFLKNQVSPHFFFNTLNNIYSLIGIDGPTAQESVLKLSKMMRYLLYESEQGETLMSHELSFMTNYIDLMKLRLSQKVDLQIDFPKDYSDFPVPPLLFIPFIENAFKHGISHREASFIKISMEIDREQIIFVAENSIGRSRQAGDMQHSGIGLENVKKRLGLLFPGKHELKIEQGESRFRVELSIRKEI